MATFVFEINDAGIELAGPDGLVAREPGFALFEDAGVRVGTRARAYSRLLPRQVFSDFWNALSTDAIGDPRVRGRSTADLAYLQLQALFEPIRDQAEAVVLVTPPDMGTEALGLLVGVARAVGMPVASIISGALASLDRPIAADAQTLYLEAGLHRTVLVSLEEDEEAVYERGCERHPLGVETVRETWLRYVSARFVERTRFDPSHSAASEQALYDRLPEWIAALHRESAIKVVLESGSGPVELELSRRELVDAAAGHFEHWRRIVSDARLPDLRTIVRIGPELAALPGLIASLLTVGDVAVEATRRGTAAEGAIRHAPVAVGRPDQSVAVVRHVDPAGSVASLATPASAPPSREESPSDEAVSHVVFAGRAHPVPESEGLIAGASPDPKARAIVVPAGPGISRVHCEISRQGDAVVVRDLSRHGTFVNETRVEGEATLRAGDRVRIGSPGLELIAISVVGESA